jgi:hypothetical protein
MGMRVGVPRPRTFVTGKRERRFSGVVFNLGDQVGISDEPVGLSTPEIVCVGHIESNDSAFDADVE